MARSSNTPRARRAGGLVVVAEVVARRHHRLMHGKGVEFVVDKR